MIYQVFVNLTMHWYHLFGKYQASMNLIFMSVSDSRWAYHAEPANGNNLPEDETKKTPPPDWPWIHISWYLPWQPDQWDLLLYSTKADWAEWKTFRRRHFHFRQCKAICTHVSCFFAHYYDPKDEAYCNKIAAHGNKFLSVFLSLLL